MEFLLDNFFILLLLLMFAFVANTLIFKIKRHDLEPEELINNYFLLKRQRK